MNEKPVPPALVIGDVGGETGEGYAKYELSVDGDRAHIAAQYNERWFAGIEG